MKLYGWHLVAGFLIGAVVVIACQKALGAFTFSSFGSYKVEAVVRDSRSDTYAALVWYHPNNDSDKSLAVWLGIGDAPMPGENTMPLQGRIGLAASSGISPEQLAFALAPVHRLIVTVPRNATISNDADDCYDPNIEADTYCLEASDVILRVAP